MAADRHTTAVALLVKVGAALDAWEHDYEETAGTRFLNTVDALLTPYQDALGAETLADGLARYFGGEGEPLLPKKIEETL